MIHEQQAGPFRSDGAPAPGSVVQEQHVGHEQRGIAGEENAASRDATVPLDQTAEEEGLSVRR